MAGHASEEGHSAGLTRLTRAHDVSRRQHAWPAVKIAVAPPFCCAKARFVCLNGSTQRGLRRGQHGTTRGGRKARRRRDPRRRSTGLHGAGDTASEEANEEVGEVHGVTLVECAVVARRGADGGGRNRSPELFGPEEERRRCRRHGAPPFDSLHGDAEKNTAELVRWLAWRGEAVIGGGERGVHGQFRWI